MRLSDQVFRIGSKKTATQVEAIIEKDHPFAWVVIFIFIIIIIIMTIIIFIIIIVINISISTNSPIHLPSWNWTVCDRAVQLSYHI